MQNYYTLDPKMYEEPHTQIQVIIAFLMIYYMQSKEEFVKQLNQDNYITNLLQ